MNDPYEAFLAGKLRRSPATGFEPGEMPDYLFSFQKDLVRWCVRRGRAALFASTGLGKTRCELAFADAVSRHTGGDVLVLAPLAVASQTVREAERIGVQATLCREVEDVRPGVSVTNYDRLHRFDASRFVGVVCDESSLIKNQNSRTLADLMAAFGQTPFRLCATATPSPNDYTELGTHAEFLGVCTRTEMLAEFFCHDGGETQKWRLKGHARREYWRWVASWAALIRKPSDLGYEDEGYDLPPMRVHQHLLPADPETVKAAGLLFAAEASTLLERRDARRSSVDARVRALVDMVTSPRDGNQTERWVIWCELNAEQDAIAKLLGDECFSVFGALDADEKERRLAAFVAGERRILLGKPSIFGWGLNLQLACRMAFVGVSDSWESYHQAIRRCWRFGQQRPVDVHVFASELEGAVISNLQRKERDAAKMGDELSAETRDVVRDSVRGTERYTLAYAPAKRMTVPAWMRRTA